MGSFRRGLILALFPGAASANVCETLRPDWSGTQVTAVEEALTLWSSPLVLLLVALSLIAIRFKHQWGSLIVVLAWTGVVTFLTMLEPVSRQAARVEGCVGSPTLFIAVIAAICVGMILYTAPPLKRD